MFLQVKNKISNNPMEKLSREYYSCKGYNKPQNKDENINYT